MNFEPQKFFIGLIDFFSILLPGALFTFLLKDELGSRLLGDEYYQLADTDSGLVFLFSSYLLGHFIFLIGSWLLDDWYDAIRNAVYERQIKRLAKGEALSCRLNRLLAARFVKKDADKAVNQAVRLKEHYLDPLKASSAINAFQWCKAKLTLEQPAAIEMVHRFEADSKFFRSLVVVLCILIPWGLVKQQPALTLTSGLLLGLAFWRYIDQRLKATNQAYWYIITLEAGKVDSFRPPILDPVAKPSHAGGVVFKRSGDRVEYLLVQAKNEPKEWVLPKGHIEFGEEMKETAVRELQEETGVWAQIREELKVVEYTLKDKPVTVQFYLMEAVEEGQLNECSDRVWLLYDKALGQMRHQESKELLELAEKAIITIKHCRRKRKFSWR